MSKPIVVADQTTENTEATLKRPPRRLRCRLLRIGLFCVVGLVALKIGDLAVGRVLQTRQRHLLRLTPNSSTQHTTIEFDYRFTTNALGLRGSDFPFDKPAGTRRIVILGDSFVAGVGVADDSIFTAQMQQVFDQQERKTEVVNVGRSGTSTIRELDLYELIGRRFQPDDVILVIYLGNDLAEITEEHDRDELQRWHPENPVKRIAYAGFPNLYLELAMKRHNARSGVKQSVAQLREQLVTEAGTRNVASEQALARFDKLPQNIRDAAAEGTFSLTRLFHGCLDPDRTRRSLFPTANEFETAWPRMKSHLDAIQAAVESDGAELRVVVLPSATQVDAEAAECARKLGYTVDNTWLEGTCLMERTLQQWAKTNGINYLDLTPIFRKSDQRLYYVWDHHMNAAGHSLTAKTLADWLGSQDGR